MIWRAKNLFSVREYLIEIVESWEYLINLVLKSALLK